MVQPGNLFPSQKPKILGIIFVFKNVCKIGLQTFRTVVRLILRLHTKTCVTCLGLPCWCNRSLGPCQYYSISKLPPSGSVTPLCSFLTRLTMKSTHSDCSSQFSHSSDIFFSGVELLKLLGSRHGFSS